MPTTSSHPFAAVSGPSPAVVARMFGVPEERVRHQYRANARQLAGMAVRAANSSRGTYRGYAPDELRRMAASAATKAEE